MDKTAIEQRLWDALREVEDPELPVSLVDLGLVVALDYLTVERAAQVQLTFTAMGCPAIGMIKDDVRERLLREPDVDRVDIDVVWSPAWSSQRVSALGRERLRTVGISL
jgi:metal-sulfur cluster biosynthetic enzyme